MTKEKAASILPVKYQSFEIGNKRSFNDQTVQFKDR